MTRRLERRDVRHPDGRPFVLYGDVPAATIAAIAAQPADSGYEVGSLHRRFDRLTRTWVLVSPSRNVRPSTTTDGDAAPACPLCPGGPELPGPFQLAVFENRFPSLAAGAPDPPTLGDDAGIDPALVGASTGRCLVVVYTGEHIEHLTALGPQGLADLVAVWRDQTSALWDEGYDYVMAFENHGAEVGATLPHLHGQLYAFSIVPPATQVKLDAHAAHRAEHDECLSCRLIADDDGSERMIAANDHFVAAVPFANRWPMEVHVRARHHGVGRLTDLDADAARDLAELLATVVARYDARWGFALPYMLCVQESPPSRLGSGADDWHLHLELLPPHRNEQRLKVRASIETELGVFINDTLPEAVATELRDAEPASAAADWSAVVVPEIEQR